MEMPPAVCRRLAVLTVACAAGAGARRLVAPARSLVPISLDTARAVLGPNPTREQLQYHWGSLGKIFEKATVTWLGPLVIAYLNNLKYLGAAEATILGSLSASFFIWGPALSALSRGSFLVSRSSSAALFFGQVAAVEQSLDDAEKRTLELVLDDGSPQLRFVTWAPWKPEYAAIRVGMAAQLVVLRSGSGRRAKANLVSECYLPDLKLYFGEYPDLNREEFEALVTRVSAEIPGLAAGDDAGAVGRRRDPLE